MEEDSARWYLVRTKQYKEVLVLNVLSNSISDTFLPRLRSKQRIWGRLTQTIVPLFPCYLFASFDVETDYQLVKRTTGVVNVLCAGDVPLEVDEGVIAEIKARGQDGIVEFPQERFSAGASVNVAAGPLKGVTAVFERYLSGSERAALLVDLIGGANVRIILPSKLLEPADDRVS